MNASQQQPHQAALGSGGGASETGAPASGSSIADKTVLIPYVLEPPRWRAPLIANKTPALYPDFFPGATALYPQSTTQSGVHVPGISRDSSLAGNGVAGTHFIPVAGITASKEDELSETIAKLGFVNKAVVQTENFSAHALIYNKLHNGPSIHALGKIVQKVLERQRADNDLLPNPGPWTYKPPSKVVYNASRLETWYSELANPSVPLSKLAKTIPSAPSSSTQGITSTGTGTYSGSSTAGASPASSSSKLSGNAIDRNLDMLITRQVPLDRALWFLQAVGQTEIGQLSRSKNLQMHPILTYSGDFTVALVECLRRQIGEALLPLTQNTGSGRLLPGMSVKGRPRNILAEEQNKDRWMIKWNYTLDLLSACLQESMLDRQRLCTLLLQNLQPHFRIQMLWWLSVILHTSMEDMLDTAWMSKTLIVALYEWLSNLGSPTGDDDASHAACEEIGQGMLRHIWLTDSEMFLIPQLWTTETQRLRLKNYVAFAEMSGKEKEDFNDLECRVDTLLCRKIPRLYRSDTAQAIRHSPDPESRPHRTSKRWHIDTACVLHLLDNWDDTQPISSLTESLFKVETKPSEQPKRATEQHGDSPLTETKSQQRRELVKLLLMWATTTTRQARHRPYLAVSVLCHYVGLPTSEFEQIPSLHSDLDANRFEELQMDIMEWIDSQESYLSKKPLPAQWTTRAATLHMCQMLLKQGILEIGGLVQKVIARGYTKAQEAEQNSIYSTILQEFNGHSEARALRWQMTRVSLSSSRTSNSHGWTLVRDQCERHIQPLIERINARSSGRQINSHFDDLYPLRDSIMSCSALRRAAIVDEWLLPTLQDALKQSSSRDLDTSAVLSIWWLLNELDAAQGQVQVITTILRDYPANEELVHAIVAAYATQRRTFAACGGRAVYAASLLTACLNLSEKLNQGFALQTFSELVKLGLQGYLDRDQLHMLRRISRTWHRPTPTLPILSNMMSPEDVDKRDEDILGDLIACLSSFTQRYGQSQQSQELLNSTLASIVSACGMPSDYFGALLPAMLQFLSHIREAQSGQINALCCLASTVASIIPPAERKQGNTKSSLSMLAIQDLRHHFSSIHAQLLQQLVLDNVASLNHLATSVCTPMLADLACQPWTNEAATSFVDMLSSMFIDDAGESTRTSLLLWARNDLFSQSAAFGTIVSVAGQILQAYENARLNGTLYSEKLRSLYHRLLALPEVQETLLKHVSAAAGISNIVPGKPGSAAHIIYTDPGVRQVLWDSLGEAIRSWSGSPSAPAQHSLHDLESPDPMTGVLDSDVFAPLVSPISRCYLELYLSQLDGVTKPSRALERESSQRRHIASQFFGHILASEAEEQQEHLNMFGQYLRPELYAVALEAILSELRSSEAITARGVDASTRAHISRLSQLVAVLDQLNATCRSKLPALADRQSFEPTQLFRALASVCSGNSSGESIYYRGTPTHLIARLTCFAMAHLQPLAEQLDAAEACGAALLQRCRLTSGMDGESAIWQDTLAWLLQDIGLARRRRLLEACQDMLLPTKNIKTTCLDRKVVSLGPHPPFAYMTCQDAYFLSLQRTWSGTSSHSNAASESNPSSNNDPIDVLKYSCQTELVESHIQAAYRPVASSGWSSFDSEIPWQHSTTFQRDFRRATITPADIPHLINSQATRSRVMSQSDIVRSQLKSQGAQVSNDAPKQLPKDKPVEQSNTSKKRKSVPDVVVIDENSPKKKNKTMTNTSNSGQASKNQRKKQQ